MRTLGFGLVVVFCLTSWIHAPAVAQKAESGKGDAAGITKEADDAFWHWKKTGNYWVIKETVTTKAATETSFMKFEITGVSEEEAFYTKTLMDKDRKVVDVQKDLAADLKATVPARGKGDEVDFECKALGKVKVMKHETKDGETVVTAWVLRHIVLKRVSRSAEKETEFELWETNLPLSSGSASKADDPYWAWKKKGNYWINKTSMNKPIEFASFVKIEIMEVSERYCTYTNTFYDKDMKESFTSDNHKMEFPAQVAEAPGADLGRKVVEQEVECKAWGKVRAVLTENDSRGVVTKIWTRKGLVVKMSMIGEDMDHSMELWETNLSKD